MATRLGVNVDHIATIREARKISEPNPVEAALLAQEAGADGITIHLREDRRHIQDHDVYAMREAITLPLNLEMGLAEDIQAIALEIKPYVITLVPEKREEVTTEGGLDVLGEFDRIAAFTKKAQAAGIRVSLFIDPDEEQIVASAKLGVEAVELHTGAYAEAWEDNAERERELKRLEVGAKTVLDNKLELIAGHGLNLKNTGELLARIPAIEELNIGHALVGRAAMIGMVAVVREYKTLMNPA